MFGEFTLCRHVRSSPTTGASHPAVPPPLLRRYGGDVGAEQINHAQSILGWRRHSVSGVYVFQTAKGTLAKLVPVTCTGVRESQFELPTIVVPLLRSP